MIKKSTVLLVCLAFLLSMTIALEIIACAQAQESQPPVTVDDYDGLWHNTDFTITLTATDDLSGVAETYYRINDGLIRNVGTHGQPLITAEGANNQLEYWSVDNEGNGEAPNFVFDIKLDKTAPIANAGSDQTVNEDTLVTFDGSASYDNIGITSYTWTFFDEAPQTLTGMNPTYTFGTPGLYTVTLNVTDAALNLAADTVEVNVTALNQPPVADANGPYSGKEGEPITFDGSDSFDPEYPDGTLTYMWDFDDGHSSTDKNPTHVYEQNGTYTITLTVTDVDLLTDTDTTTVIVDDTAPRADFSYSQDTAPLTISFSDQSTSYDGLVSWFWDFGDEKTSAQQNPTHKFPRSPRIFDVSLTVTDADGSTDTITKQVSIINSPPTADFEIVSSEKPTVNEDISFIDKSSDPDGGIVSWFWDFGDGQTSTAQNVAHRYQSLGTYIVSLTITDNAGGTDMVSKEVTIYDVMSPVTVDGYDGLWHNTDFTITLTATDDLSGVAETYYRINEGPIRNVGTHGQPLITTQGANNQLEYWSVDNEGNEEAPHILDDIKLDKTAPIADAGYYQTVNEDTLVTFDGSASYDNIGKTSYTWTFFDESPQTLTGMNSTYTFYTPGLYTVTLTVTDAAFNYATDTVTITVIDITNPVANAGDDRVTHGGVAVTFDGSGSTDNVEVVSYVWTFVDVTPQTLLGVNAPYIFVIPGVYDVTLIVADGQGNLATDTVTITVVDATWPVANAGPDQIVDEDTLVNFDGSASTDNVAITSYVWTFTDGTLKTLFGVNPSHTFETPGVYTVTLNVTDAEDHFTTDTVVITVRDMTPPQIEIGNYETVVENSPVNLDASRSLDNVAIINYQWDFGDGTFENTTIPSAIHTYTKPGVYTVMLTVVDESGNANSVSISIVVHRDTDGDFLADHIDTDDDNDGMPDDWEILHGLDPLDASDASLDRDADGFSNLKEYRIDSDPNVYTSPSPFPLFVVLTVATTGFIFSGVLFVRIRRREDFPEETRKR